MRGGVGGGSFERGQGRGVSHVVKHTVKHHKERGLK